MDSSAAGLLAQTFGYGHAVLFGRARSAIAALIREFGTPGLPVVLPSNVCPDLCLAIEASSAQPHLVSVDAASGLPTDARLAAALRALPAGIVMPCHLYGIWQDHPECLEAARHANWFVLENDTLLATARLERGAARLAKGDALLLSFGNSKTISLGNGGALLTDDPALAAALRGQLRDRPPSGPALAEHETRVALLRRMHRDAPIDPDPQAGVVWSFPADLEKPLHQALLELPRSVDRLRRQHGAWSKALARHDLSPAPVPRVPWRWIARVPRARDAVVAALRQAGFDAGTNFPPLWRRSPRWSADPHRADADRWGEQVLNLWLHEADDAARLGTAAALIDKALAEHERPE